MPHRASLASRLALAIAAAVGIIVVATGVLVGSGVIGRFDAYLDEARAGRYRSAAALAADLVTANGGLDLRKQDLRELAVSAGGPLEIRDPSGAVVARIDSLPGVSGGAPGGRTPTGEPVEVPIVVAGTEAGTLVVYPLAGSATEAGPAPSGFRETAALILLAAGLGIVVASALVSWVLARRLTRPLRDLATASHRIGSGDLSTRVVPPPDAEGHELGEAFNAMAANLERSEELRRRAAGDLAHELATPVTVLAGRLQALADGIIAPDPAELAATRDAADEVRRLVGDLQELAAAEGAVLQRSVQRADLAAIACAAAGSTRALFAEAGVTLVGPEGETAAIPVDVDARQVERALVNVLTNAARYTGRGGRTEILAGASSSAGRVRVRDTGPGIPAEHLPRIFERYYRVDPARRRDPAAVGGTGIGLTVARELAVANGGRLEVEATGPAGTTFLLEVPLAR